MNKRVVETKWFGLTVIFFLSVCVLLVSSKFLWTGHLNTSGLGGSMNDQPGYIVTARNIAEHGRFESTIYYPAKVPYYKSHNVPYMPGNYYIRALFFYIFGYSLFVSFLPNLLAFIGSSLLLFLIADRIFGRTTAYLATVLFMIFPPLTLYAFSAMMENVFIFACLLSFYFFIRMPEKLRYILGVLPLLPAVLIRETAIFMIFGYAAMIFLSESRKAHWKSIIFVVVSLAVILLLFQIPPMSDRPPTFYARLINTFSLHYTDAYALQNISFSAFDTIRLVAHHFLQNVSYLLTKLASLSWGMGFTFFMIVIALLVVAVIVAVRGLSRNKQFAYFAIVTAIAELLAIFLFYDYYDYTGIRLSLFWLPFLLCILFDAVVSGKSSWAGAEGTVVGISLVSSALLFFIYLGDVSQNYAEADAFDRQCNNLLKSVVTSDVNFFAAPFYLSLDYVYESYPVKWSFLPDNEKTLKLLARKYPVDLLVVPFAHPLVRDDGGSGSKDSLLDGVYKKTSVKNFFGNPYLIFRRQGISP